MSYDLLADVRVIEVSMYAFAPAAGAVLADWGADVVKVVPGEAADPMLSPTAIAGLPTNDTSLPFMWQLLNRGKRCIALDLSTEPAREILHELVATADVFITNLLPDARRRFGLEPEEVLAAHPRLVYARASGHGPEGPERDDGGFDHTDFWARTGIAHAASQVSDEFVPQPIPAMGDLSSGAFLAGGVAAALFRRERTGAGGIVDVSLLSSGMWVGQPSIVASRLYDVPTIPRMRHADAANAFVGAYRTRDGRLVNMAGIRTDKGFDEFCALIGRPEIADDPRFATASDRSEHRRALIELMDDVFAERDLAEWVEVLRQFDTPWTVVKTAAEAAADPQATANHYLVPVTGHAVEFELVPSPAQFDERAPVLTPAPEHGQHTEEVLLDLGRTWDDIARLQAESVIP
jgi:crotonobetainyl-CoA:carnitine CoA-transferase CaiB-like acyl-CoA transferase